ncbi:hypothetical protein CNMCM7691_008136 [Aspergillus felis]|uniref:Uncharacterized protein n=1 Tax=Aspergillus felis TaxID=1287682 RepID=A0A8H6QT52_9EURO|nr:hypothetical protein CNMCM7691_008136 [Aspergillus felis]
MITDCKFSSKLSGLPKLVVGRLQDLLKDHLTDSGDSDINPPEPGQRSVKLKLEIARDTAQKTVRVLKKEKKVIGLRDVVAYISERSQELLLSYFPFDEDVPKYEWLVTLTLKVIMKPLHMNTNAATKIYVEIDEDIQSY